MRIVVTSDYLSTKPSVHGYQSQQLMLAEAFTKMGHEVFVISGKRKGLDHKTLEKMTVGFRIRLLPSFELPMLSKLFQMYISGLTREIKIIRPDLIICNELHSFQTLRINLQIARKTPTVLIQGRFAKSSHSLFNILLSSYDNVYRLCGLHLQLACKTSTAAAYLGDTFRIRTSVIPVGVSDLFRPLTIATEYDFIFVGAFSEIKRPLSFIKIIAECVSLGWNGKALMVGKGPLEDSVKQLITEYKLHCYIEIIDYVANLDMPELYNRSKVLVSLSRTEIFGMVYLEALACGCQVFCTDTAGSKDLAKEFNQMYILLDSDYSKTARKLLAAISDNYKVNSSNIASYRWSIIGKQIIALGHEHT